MYILERVKTTLEKNKELVFCRGESKESRLVLSLRCLFDLLSLDFIPSEKDLNKEQNEFIYMLERQHKWKQCRKEI
jgi:hypothetical protein